MASALLVIASVLFGGGQGLSPLLIGGLALTAACVATLAIDRGGIGRFRSLPHLTQLALLCPVLLPAIQLLPLPHDLWAALPGRELPSQVLAAAGQPQAWHPMTLAVSDTVFTLSVSLWLISLVLAVLTMSEAEVRAMLWLLVGLAVLHLAVGVIQFLTHGDRLSFYRLAHRGALIGFFANKNHSALFIAMMTLFGVALFSPAQLRDRRIQLAMVGVALVLVVALIATLSRAGFVLGLTAIGCVVGLQLLERRRTNWRLLAGVSAGLTLALLVISTSSAAGRIFYRFGDVTGDVRQEFWQHSWPVVATYLPWGTGFGAFPIVFELTERLDWLTLTYLNHVHNDYIELAVEAGWLGVAALLLLVVALGRHGTHAWKQRRSPTGRLAVLALAAMLLCLAHSFVDYPLRRLGISVLFAFAAALLVRPTAGKAIARVDG